MNFGKATESAVISCNVSHVRTIDAETLIDVLNGSTPVGDWMWHLAVFFNELPIGHIKKVLSDNSLSIEQAVSIFHSLPTPLQGKNFKELIKYE